MKPGKLALLRFPHTDVAFDEIVSEEDPDFVASGLKRASVVRIGRLAIVEANLLLGEIGEISTERLIRIRRRLADWIMGCSSSKAGYKARGLKIERGAAGRDESGPRSEPQGGARRWELG